VGFVVVMVVLVFVCGNCNYQQFRFLKSIRSNIVSNMEDAESVLHRDSRSVHRRRRAVLNSTEQPEVLDLHNRLRRQEGGSNMELLIWDNNLANAAERTALNCTWNHSNYGQNLYTSTSVKPIDLTAAIEAWYNEKPYYNNYYNTNTCNPADQPCLHYSQVVWGPSRKLGCAYTRCPTLAILNWQNALFLVCNYDPTGNIRGVKPYTEGVPCSQCASGSWYCNNGLCDGSCTATGPSCDCPIMCKNYATVNSATCSCSCAPGWYGSDCSGMYLYSNLYVTRL
jgi:hypothetical protein